MTSLSYLPQRPYPVTHAIQVQHLGGAVDVPSFRIGLAATPGVLSVVCDHEAITITYDLRRVHLQEIEDTIQGMGIELKHGLWSRLEHLAVHVIEELEDNQQFATACRPHYEYDPFLYRKLRENNPWISVYPPSGQRTDTPCGK